ncbi:fabG2 [Scenedesmus sp. PABB004]|nr:fabG2 [Scenedesmus sp. PABB004]
MQRLLRKTAIVTGGARGIGLAVAQALGAEGAAVMLGDVDAAAGAEAVAGLSAAGVRAEFVPCDVSCAAQVDALVAATVERLGGVDILVANAGIVRAAPFLEMSEADFDAVLAVNLKGAFLACQAAARAMVAAGRGGAIITMSSVNGVMAIPTIAGYNASKGGIDNLTRCMALALAPHGIRVNAIGPGSIDTDVLASVVADKAAMERVLSRTPLGRVGQPSEIGSVAAFLASQDASYMTGQIIYVDGGRMALNYTVPVPARE